MRRRAPMIRPNVPHAHVNVPSLLVIIATVIATNFLLRTFAAHHADSAWAKGLAYDL